MNTFEAQGLSVENGVDVSGIEELKARIVGIEKEISTLTAQKQELWGKVRSRCPHPTYRVETQNIEDEYGTRVSTIRYHICTICERKEKVGEYPESRG